MRSIKDIKINRLIEITDKIKQKYNNMISKYQGYLDKSESKEEDYVIIDFAMEDLMEKMYDNADYNDYEAIFLDSESATLPMPEGVINQCANILYKPKHLEILYDCYNVPLTLEESSTYSNVEQAIDDVRKNFDGKLSDSKPIRNKLSSINDSEESQDKKVYATCETQRTSTGFKHIVNLYVDDKLYKGVAIYMNRAWEAFDYQTALIDAIKKTNLFNKDEIYDLYKINSFENVIEEVKKRV